MQNCTEFANVKAPLIWIFHGEKFEIMKNPLKLALTNILVHHHT
jgi:hypothetical protein